MLPSSMTISLDRSDPRTLPIQLADRIRASIARGELSDDVRLPSSRALATGLGVARGIVERAYEQLIAEGWLTSRPGSGTYVVRLPSIRAPHAIRVPEPPQASTLPLISLRPGVPWTPPRASAAWKRAWRTAGAHPPPANYPDPAGEPALRSAIASLLGRARGLHTGPESILVTSGTVHGLGLTLAALTPPAPAPATKPFVAIEDPGYRAAVASAGHFGWSVHDVPVDRHGLEVDKLHHAPATTRAVYVTPSHQYPTGGLLTIGRRRALAEYARTHDAMIIEDDYDSEFRYDVAPLPTLAELAPDRTVYLGTVAKTIGAGLRLGWLVAPPELIQVIRSRRKAIADFPSVPLQHAMLSLLRDGEWDRTVRSARRIYRARDNAVARALSPFGELRGVGAGLHTTLVLDATTAVAVRSDAAAAGIDVSLVAESSRGQSNTAGIVVGYGALTDAELDRALAVLAASLGTRAVS